jgi:hypothetical protein
MRKLFPGYLKPSAKDLARCSAVSGVTISTELLVTESSPQVPAGDGAEWAPLLNEARDTSLPSVDIFDGSFESDVAQGKHVGIAKDHDAEH